jgi:hypothetical protein
MRTIVKKTKVYKFSELSEAAQKVAIENLYDINVSYDWWEFTYEDAEQVGIKITGFDIDRGSHCDIEFIDSAPEVANAIKENHGEQYDSYKTAVQFLTDYDKLVEKYSDGINKNKVSEDNDLIFDQEADELEEKFKKAISEDYLKMLREEYEYQISEEAIKETIEANDYEFTKDGSIY